MIKLDEVVENIMKIKNVDKEDLWKEVSDAWEDYEVDGFSEISDLIGGRPKPHDEEKRVFYTVLEHCEAPEIGFECIENEDGTYSVVDAFVMLRGTL